MKPLPLIPTDKAIAGRFWLKTVLWLIALALVVLGICKQVYGVILFALLPGGLGVLVHLIPPEKDPRWIKRREETPEAFSRRELRGERPDRQPVYRGKKWNLFS